MRCSAITHGVGLQKLQRKHSCFVTALSEWCTFAPLQTFRIKRHPLACFVFLSSALLSGHTEVVRFLLEACKVNPVPRDRWVQTLHHQRGLSHRLYLAQHLHAARLSTSWLSLQSEQGVYCLFQLPTVYTLGSNWGPTFFRGTIMTTTD